jgi:superfamily II DNA or RNA helicase
MGVYPLLQDETCCFLAVDFDKDTWQEDVKAFIDTCKLENIPAALERSRSGNGAHIWIFFEKKIAASKARKLGSFLMTKTLDRRPEIGLDSFDRFFPNQDTLPKGGFGNLIALPLQKSAREKNHSIFPDRDMSPYTDQWAFLSSIKPLDEIKLDEIINNAIRQNELLPVIYDPVEDEDDSKPWERKSASLPTITESLPQKIEIVLADQLYVNHTGLPPILRNRILRLASFANPEFYRAQRMRLPTWNKPHILYCYEYFPEHIGLPVGCLDSLIEIFDHYKIKVEFQNKQNRGKSIVVNFIGELRDEQKDAAQKLLAKQTGILSASTAFGKTVVALRIIAERRVNTLILVHRKLLADQWAERINQFLGIPKKEIGCYSGTKKKRTGIIDIAVMQSIVKKDKVEDWITDYGQIIVDECHHISASSFERIIRKCPAYYRLGLSATVIRKDGQHPIVLMNMGEVRYSNTNSTKDVFIKKVFPRLTSFYLPNEFQATNEKPLDINEIFRSLYTNEKRNELIVSDILEAYNEGRNCLVLSERLEHLDILHDLLSKNISAVFILKGGLGKKQIKAIMESIQNKLSEENIVILATGKYLGEGFDLPNLDTLFLVFPFSWKGILIQYTGRLNRTYHGKNEIQVYDYVEEQVPVLAKMYRRRLKGYNGLGFTVGV